jgi:lipoprotein-releasing system ATP-binding protein
MEDSSLQSRDAMVNALIQARSLVKGYRTAAGHVSVLEGVDLDVAEGEMLAITGASGVGKSTLLHVLGTLDRPDAGTVSVAGQDVFALSEASLRQFRNQTLGFVFQFHHLLPEFTALENVMMPLLIARRPEGEAHDRAALLLSELGLAARAQHRPGMLSGGEQQRVAVARALSQSPRVLLADEPTGNLDRQTGEKLHGLLRQLNRERGITVVLVTHSESVAAACDRTLRLDAGKLLPVQAQGPEGH